MVSKPPLKSLGRRGKFVWTRRKFRIVKCTSLSTGVLATSGILERVPTLFIFSLLNSLGLETKFRIRKLPTSSATLASTPYDLLSSKGKSKSNRCLRFPACSFHSFLY